MCGKAPVIELAATASLPTLFHGKLTLGISDLNVNAPHSYTLDGRRRLRLENRPRRRASGRGFKLFRYVTFLLRVADSDFPGMHGPAAWRTDP